jgi:hypothetical protein
VIGGLAEEPRTCIRKPPEQLSGLYGVMRDQGRNFEQLCQLQLARQGEDRGRRGKTPDHGQILQIQPEEMGAGQLMGGIAGIKGLVVEPAGPLTRNIIGRFTGLHIAECGWFGEVESVNEIEDSSNASAYLDLAHGKRIDALMVLNPQLTDKGLVKLIEMRSPVIVFGSIRHPKENSLSTADFGAAREATAHLISLGHRRIAHISYAPLSYLAADARFQGYRQALKEAGIAFDKKLLATGNFNSESGFDAMHEILRRRVIPTALFASNDTIAVGAMAAIRAAGLSVPADIAVVGLMICRLPLSLVRR